MSAEPTPSEQLAKFIRAQITQHGPVSFKWYMQQALYHPELGYYGGGRARIGRQGDFYTSVSVGKIYGELLAKQFEEMWLRMNAPMTFAIVEEGAHGGQFAHDVLTWLQRFSPDLYRRTRYWIVEPNPRLQAEQQARLAPWPRNKVRWSPALATFETGSLVGVHFSNELIDAFPVHVVTCADDRWQENFVDLTRDGFHFVYGPPSNAPLREHLRTLPLPPPSAQPYRTEVNLAALRWVDDLARVIGQGYLLAADYGMPRDEYLAPGRREGTLTGYRAHERQPDPFAQVGDSDLTAHVDFTTLAERAEARGFELAGYCDQHHFLVGLGEEELMAIERSVLASGEEPGPELAHHIRAFKTLMHPATMGRAFQFVAFGKRLPDASRRVPLSGFRYGGDPRATLGLTTAPAERTGAGQADPYAAY